MLIKLAVLGGLGYAGYKYFNANRPSSGTTSMRRDPHDNAVAGGPFSSQARLQHSADAPGSETPPAL